MLNVTEYITLMSIMDDLNVLFVFVLALRDVHRVCGVIQIVALSDPLVAALLRRPAYVNHSRHRVDNAHRPRLLRRYRVLQRNTGLVVLDVQRECPQCFGRRVCQANVLELDLQTRPIRKLVRRASFEGDLTADCQLHHCYNSLLSNK